MQIQHELGFSILLIDLGRPLDAKAQKEKLKLLADSVADSYSKVKGAKPIVGKPYSYKFASGTAGRWTPISYTTKQGDKDVGHTCAAWVLSGPPDKATFTVTCLIQYRDEDKDEVRPLVKKILDSIRPLP